MRSDRQTKKKNTTLRFPQAVAAYPGFPPHLSRRTSLTPTAFADAAGERGNHDIYAWKVVYERPQSRKSQASERFYATYAEADAIAQEAMRSDDPEYARLFGTLKAYAQRVRTTIHSLRAPA